MGWLNMKKKITILVFIPLLILFASCGLREEYEFMYSEDQISEICIVALSFDDNGEMQQKDIKKIEDINAFLTGFRNVECYTYFGDPTGITEEGVAATVIKVMYKSDEYELINWNGQAEYSLERGFRYYSGYSVFDREQFEALIVSLIDE